MSIEAYQRDAAMNAVEAGTFTRDDIVAALYRASVPIGELQDEADAFLAELEAQGYIGKQEQELMGPDTWQKL